MSTKEMAIEIVETMTRRNKWLCFAESCTAGGVPKVITSVPGASKMFLGGLTAYAPEALAEFLSMSLSEIEEKGVVSETVAAALANHGLHRFRGDICIGTTGYLGPFEDGLPEHHEAWVAVVYRDGAKHKFLLTEKLHLEGRREANRQAMLRAAFGLVLKAFRQEAGVELKIKNVVEYPDGRRRMIFNDADLVEAQEGNARFICESAHQDGRFDYTCSHPYCRCKD